MISVPGFWELKRTRTERPEFGDPPTIRPRLTPRQRVVTRTGTAS